MDIVERFLQYVRVNSQSNPESNTCPSTPEQLAFAQKLAADLRDIGMADVEVSQYGYVTATLPANTDAKIPTVGFIAHLDTSPDTPANNVQPRIIKEYDGDDIHLNDPLGVVMTTDDFPELLQYKGQDLIVTDGTTLLGADDKAGIAAIFTALENLIAHPEILHGKVRICFTPDEEIGRGADHFDVKAFGADFAYTIDGGTLGELQYESFNAAEATVDIAGRNVHPGYAFNKLRNSMTLATRFIASLPANEVPESTTGFDGFFHLVSFNGTVEKTTMHFLIRDFKRSGFDQRKQLLVDIARAFNRRIGAEYVEVAIRDTYYNMKEMTEPVSYVVDYARQAMADCGVSCHVLPVRGGTDGSRLSFMGLPTPNIFSGGENFHGRYEFLPIESLRKSAEVVERIVQVVANARS